jgi:hypothetical protein
MICNRQQALDSRFYTYLWLRADGTPYYVGKGKGQRGYQHHKAQHKHRPESAARIFVQYWATSEEAAAMEMWYIRLFGRKDLGTGILRNQTDGGDGRSHYKHTPETIAKLRATHLRLGAHRNFKHTPEQIEKQRKAQLGRVGAWKGKTMPKSIRDKMSATRTGKATQPWSAQSRINIMEGRRLARLCRG